MSKGAPPERGWVVEHQNSKDGSWFIMSFTFERTREEALTDYLGYCPSKTCPHCWWRKKQRDGKARCVRVVLQEEE